MNIFNSKSEAFSVIKKYIGQYAEEGKSKYSFVAKENATGKELNIEIELLKMDNGDYAWLLMRGHGAENLYILDDFTIVRELQHGGKRDGAGRPSLGVTKKVSVTLPEVTWKKIQQEIDSHPDIKSMSSYFRKIVLDKF